MWQYADIYFQFYICRENYSNKLFYFSGSSDASSPTLICNEVTTAKSALFFFSLFHTHSACDMTFLVVNNTLCRKVAVSDASLGFVLRIIVVGVIKVLKVACKCLPLHPLCFVEHFQECLFLSRFFCVLGNQNHERLIFLQFCKYFPLFLKRDKLTVICFLTRKSRDLQTFSDIRPQRRHGSDLVVRP